MVFAPLGPMVLLGGFTVPLLLFVVPLLMPVVPGLPASPAPTAPAAAPLWPVPPAAAPPGAPAPAARAIEELTARTEAKTIVVNFMCFPFRCCQDNDDLPFIVPRSHGGLTKCHPATTRCRYSLNISSNSALARCNPSSVKTTDFTLPMGSWIMLLSCSRPSTPQSKPFQARESSCSAR